MHIRIQEQRNRFRSTSLWEARQMKQDPFVRILLFRSTSLWEARPDNAAWLAAKLLFRSTSLWEARRTVKHRNCNS